MRLPVTSTSAVALCLAIVTAFGVSVVRTGAPRERERAVRTTRGISLRLDSGEAVHGHEEISIATDVSGDQGSELAARPETDPNVLAVMPGGQVDLRRTVFLLSSDAFPPTTPLKASLIPPLPGRAPPSL